MPPPLHRVKFSWGADTHLELEWSKGRGRLLDSLPAIPNLAYAEEELDPDEPTVLGVPALCWRNNVPVLFERFQLRENTEYYLDVTLPLSLEDARSAADLQPGWPFNERLAIVFQADPFRRWRCNVNGTVTISGQLRLRNHAGILDLSLGDNRQLVVEIVCQKIGYFDEFKAMLDAVAEESSELLLQYDSPASASFNLADAAPASEAALLFQLRHIMADRNLPTALEEVRRSFHSRLVNRQTTEPLSGIEEPDVTRFIAETDPSSLVKGGPLAKLFRGYTPREFPVMEMHETSDTAENRYIKFFLEELQRVGQRLATALARHNRRASVREVQEWLDQLDEELASDIWRSVGEFRTFPSNSQVLQKRRGYREILKLDLSLRMSLEMPWKRAEALADGLIGDIRPVNELYEYWCFFLLRRSLSELAEAELPSDGSLIDVREGGFQVRLLRGRRSRISYLYRRVADRSLQINFFYNRTFPRPSRELAIWHGSYTARFDPDYSIELLVQSELGTQRHWLHFDAKYRIERGELMNLFNAFQAEDGIDEDAGYETEMRRVHRREDLYKMHTYRDGILGSRGAYILFPGDRAGIQMDGPGKNLFVRHPSGFGEKPQYLFPGVGAFDLCPGRELTQRPIIREFLRNVCEAVFAGEPYCEEEGLLRI